MTQRILLVDDDVELCELLVDYLEPEGFHIDLCHDGIQGLSQALSGQHSLVILDVMLPGLQGFEVLRRLREKSHIPVIMLTARGDDVDRIVGLEMGADDYLPKPFNPREMVARIRAIGRRAYLLASDGPTARRFEVGDLALDQGSRQVTRAGAPASLTAVEFSLLELLMRQPGQVVSREEISAQVLGREASPLDRSIDVHVSNLRKKLGPHPLGEERIQAVRGVGYVYVSAPEPTGPGTPNAPGKADTSGPTRAPGRADTSGPTHAPGAKTSDEPGPTDASGSRPQAGRRR